MRLRRRAARCWRRANSITPGTCNWRPTCMAKAWNPAGKGQIISGFGTTGRTDHGQPDRSRPADLGDRRANARSSSRTPSCTDQGRCDKALSMAIDRPNCWSKIGYGDGGPGDLQLCCRRRKWLRLRHASIDDCKVQDIEGANKPCWKRPAWTDTNGNGVRDKDGVRAVEVLFQTSTNAVRQDFQALIKHDGGRKSASRPSCATSIPASIFGGDAGQSRTRSRSSIADVRDVRQQLRRHRSPRPTCRQLVICDQIAGAGKPVAGGTTCSRFCSEEYNALVRRDAADRGRATRSARNHRPQAMNDMADRRNGVIIPLVRSRPGVRPFQHARRRWSS